MSSELELPLDKPKIILLNGNKCCGKNTLLNYVSEYIPMRDASCKVHLYKLVQDFFLVSEQRFWEIYNDRGMKEKPLPEFRVRLSDIELRDIENILDAELIQPGSEYLWKPSFGEYQYINLSVRNAMIYLSEIIIKPRLGTSFFGRARIHLIKSSRNDLWHNIYYDDSSSCFNGDSSELDGLVDFFGEDGILLVRIKGRGTFEGDSRSYHPDGVIKHTVDLWNDKDEQSFLKAGSKIIEDFLLS